MKRKIALLILALLALSAVLAACNSVTPTEIVTRWADEEYVYKISKADYDDPNAPTKFQSYPQGELNYYRDFGIQTSGVRETLPSEELIPKEVSGTYKLTVKRNGEYDVMTTEQIIYASYDKKDLEADWSKLSACQASADSDPFAPSSERYTLTSTNKTSVKFEHKTSQRPIESSVSVNGFYIGKTAKTVSKYEVSAKYAYDDKSVTATVIKDGSETSSKIGINAASKFIDASQIVLYARSLEKAATFQDAPATMVFNPQSGATHTAKYVLQRSQNAVITRGGANDYLKLDTTAIVVDNNAFMMQTSVPKLEALDTMPSGAGGGSVFSKYTTVRFRVGYLAYEIENFYSDELVAAIKAAGEKK